MLSSLNIGLIISNVREENKFSSKNVVERKMK
jgi:hypothetical protein